MTTPWSRQEPNTDIVVRPISVGDRCAIWDWRNDPVKGVAIPVISRADYSQHKEWYRRTVDNKRVFFSVGLVETLRIGCVRFDLEVTGVFGVRFFLKPVYCGRGIGSQFLKKSVALLQEHRSVKRVVAIARHVSPSTIAVYTGAGFEVIEDDRILQFEFHCGTL